MLEKAIGHHYQSWFVNRIACLIKQYVTPVQISIAGGILGICTMPALAYQKNTLAVILLLASGYLDTLDGTIARIKNQISDLGSVLDIFIDRCVEFSVILGLWLIQPDSRSLECLIMLGSILLCVTSFLVVGIFTPNHSQKSFNYTSGIMERAEAFIFFILMIFLPHFFNALAWMFIFLVFVTTLIRLCEFAKVSACDSKKAVNN